MCVSSSCFSASRLGCVSICFWSMVIVGVFVIPFILALSFPLRVERSMISMGSSFCSQ